MILFIENCLNFVVMWFALAYIPIALANDRYKGRVRDYIRVNNGMAKIIAVGDAVSLGYAANYRTCNEKNPLL